MEIKLHRLATTTPATRTYIQTSNKTPTLSRELIRAIFGLLTGRELLDDQL